MSSKLDQLREMTVVVADTGDIDAIRKWQPVDCTTNPTLLLKAIALQGLSSVVDEVLQWGRGQKLARDVQLSRVADRLAVSVGTELTRIVPGRVSTEVDASLSFDTQGSVEKAREIIAAYAERGVARNRVLIKLASTWEGVQAARVLQKESIDCNMTLLFCLAQAMAAADAGVFLISPFVGRIYDWYVKSEGHKFEPEDDPGVKSVRAIYAAYKARGIKTVVMGASFRSSVPGSCGGVPGFSGDSRRGSVPMSLLSSSRKFGEIVRRSHPASAST